MQEDTLQYIWKFQKFNSSKLTSTQGDEIQVKKIGHHNFHAGPDFLQAQIFINDQLWAGNVEIHIRSSNWYDHHHHLDKNYDNVILHVVWEHNLEVYRRSGQTIPTLVMKDVVNTNVLKLCEELLNRKHSWIPCENDFPKVDDLVLKPWLDRLFLERLEDRSTFIQTELDATNGHWEAVLFRIICKNFGLNLNGEAFLGMAKSIDYRLLLKYAEDPIELEALLMGQLGLLEKDQDDSYFVQLQKRYGYQKYKHGLVGQQVQPSQFFRLRPLNFPTIRVSQLANLFSKKPQLFSNIIAAKSLIELHEILDVTANPYWSRHYNFGVPSKEQNKRLSKKFKNLLIMNAIIPMKLCFSKYQDKEIGEALLSLASEIPRETNTIVRRFNKLRLVAENAMDSQALLQLKQKYCDHTKCLLCAIGNSRVNCGKSANLQ